MAFFNYGYSCSCQKFIRLLKKIETQGKYLLRERVECGNQGKVVKVRDCMDGWGERLVAVAGELNATQI